MGNSKVFYILQTKAGLNGERHAWGAWDKVGSGAPLAERSRGFWLADWLGHSIGMNEWLGDIMRTIGLNGLAGLGGLGDFQQDYSTLLNIITIRDT